MHEVALAFILAVATTFLKLRYEVTMVQYRMTMQIPFRTNLKLSRILLHHCVGSKYSHSHLSLLIHDLNNPTVSFNCIHARNIVLIKLTMFSA